MYGVFKERWFDGVFLFCETLNHYIITLRTCSLFVGKIAVSVQNNFKHGELQTVFSWCWICSIVVVVIVAVDTVFSSYSNFFLAYWEGF
jgi:hypothetical protein